MSNHHTGPPSTMSPWLVALAAYVIAQLLMAFSGRSTPMPPSFEPPNYNMRLIADSRGQDHRPFELRYLL